jgi:hypothetical protein
MREQPSGRRAESDATGAVYADEMVRIGWPWRTVDERVQLIDSEQQAAPDPAAVLLRIAAEAVILQDEAESVLKAVSRREALGRVAPRGGPLVSRFFILRDQLPSNCVDPRLEGLRARLDTILHHHATQVATALDFLASDERSELLQRQVGAFSGLGPPARLLDASYRELRGDSRDQRL